MYLYINIHHPPTHIYITTTKEKREETEGRKGYN